MQTTLSFLKRYPFAMLLAVQLFSVLFYGFMTDSKTSHVIFNCLGLIVPILAVWTVYSSPATNWVGFVLVSASIGTTLLALLGGQTQLLIWAHAFESLLYFYAAVSLVMYMFKDDIVTVDELFAAGATFTLLVWGFALVYSVCQQIYPGSITGGAAATQLRSWIELLFFSFSVQSGTGLSDLLPVSPQSRAIAALQMFSGVMYITIVVSHLVGLAASAKK
jgi:predicted small integral membrane protein